MICGLLQWYPECNLNGTQNELTLLNNDIVVDHNNSYVYMGMIMWNSKNTVISSWNENLSNFLVTSVCCKNRSINRKIFSNTSLESWRFILFDEIILGTIWVTHKSKFAYEIIIKILIKSLKFYFFELDIINNGTQSGTQSFLFKKYDVWAF